MAVWFHSSDVLKRCDSYLHIILVEEKLVRRRENVKGCGGICIYSTILITLPVQKKKEISSCFMSKMFSLIGSIKFIFAEWTLS